MDRLQKVMAHAGVASRRKSEELIASGKVKVNGKVITDMGYLVDQNDTILVDNHPIQKEENVYYVLNKPTGYISTVNDELGRKTVMDLIKPEDKNFRIYPVGRLDYDTAGVLFLTNDGKFANKLTSPKSEIEKEYIVRIEGIITKLELLNLEKGVTIEGGYTTKRCKTYKISFDHKNRSSLVGIIIKEGKYHQVRLMFEAIGHPVKGLTRKRVGVVEIGDLERGKYRKLKIHEIKQLMVD